MKLKTIYMNKSKRLFCKLAFAALGLLPTMATTALADTTDYTQYVNPFVGNADNGHTFPGACRPFGMIQTSPVTGAVGWRYCSESFIATLSSGDLRRPTSTARAVWTLATYS